MSTQQTPEELGYTPAPAKAKLRRWPIPPGAPEKTCRSCSAPIVWIVTASGKRMPVDPDGVSHFETCPNAAQHRRSGAEIPELTSKQRTVLNAVADDRPMTIRTDNRHAWSDLQRLKLIELAPNHARWLITDLGKAALERR